MSDLSYPSAHAATSVAGARSLSATLPAAPLWLLAAALARIAPLPARPPPDRHASPAPPSAARSPSSRDEDRHRRAAERRQVVALQRAHEGGRGGRQLPVHDGRAECRDRARARRAARPGGRDVGARPVVHETIAFHDIAGLVRGAHSGEGLGNQFLANIRETDAILHVVRAHDDPQVVHPEGRWIRPRTSRRSRPSCSTPTSSRPSAGSSASSKQAKSLDKALVAEEAWLRELVAGLQEGRPARDFPPPADAPDALAQPPAADARSRCCTWRTSARTRRSSRPPSWRAAGRARWR